MQNKDMASTWESCREYLTNTAAKDEGFVLVVPEGDFDNNEFSEIPKDKLVVVPGPESCVALRAAGFALEGRRPWIAAASSAFVSRAYGALRDALAAPSLPVVTVVAGAGFSRGQDGVSSLIIEDVALMRAMPGMSVFVPSDRAAALGAAAVAATGELPVYLRCGLAEVLNIEDRSDEPFHAGGARILCEGTDVTICSSGIMTGFALEAAEMLERQGISAEVIDCYSVKPFPEQMFLSSVRRTGCCVAAEEGCCVGGLGGAAAECLGRTYPVPMRFVAIDDHFAGGGTPDELREYCGLTSREIVNAAAQVWALRRR